VEIIEGIAAVAEFERLAQKAAIEITEVARLIVREGNPGDDAINDWLAAIPAFCCDLLSRGASGRFRDAAGDVGSRLEQDHTYLGGLVEPASQPGVQPAPVQAARRPQADALEKQDEEGKVKTCERLILLSQKVAGDCHWESVN